MLANRPDLSRHTMAIGVALAALLSAADASAQLTPDWDVRHFGVDGFFFSFNVPANIVTDSEGAVYFNGAINRSRFTDMLTVKYAPDGTEVWSVIYAGPSGNPDSGKGITIDSAGDGAWICRTRRSCCRTSAAPATSTATVIVT